MSKSIKELIFEANNLISEECENSSCDECKFNKYIDNSGEYGLCYTVSMLAGAYTQYDKLIQNRKKDK
jgi:hypothetical protein